MVYGIFMLWFFAGRPTALLSKRLPPAGIRLLVGLFVFIVSTAIEMAIVLMRVLNSPYTLDTKIAIAVYLAGLLGFALYSYEACQLPVDRSNIAWFALFMISLAVCFLVTATICFQLTVRSFVVLLFFVAQLALLIVDLYYVIKLKIYLASTVVTKTGNAFDVKWLMPKSLPV